MTDLKIETQYHHPAFASILHGLSGVFQKLDDEIQAKITELDVEISGHASLAAAQLTMADASGYCKGQQDALRAIVDADTGWEVASIMVNEDIHILTELMHVESWESVDAPTGGCGDSISYSSSRIPSDYSYDEPWVKVIFDNLAEDVVEKINLFFEEKGE